MHPICQAYLAAAEEAQIPFNPDYNAAAMDGAAIYQVTTRGGFRASTSRCYLRPALKRANLRLVLGAHVTRIMFEGRRATGIRYRHQGAEHVARARREVILAAGAINSPQVLQLSGIGPAGLLGGHGIPVVIDAPHVGGHLQDHLCTDNLYRARIPTLNQLLRPWAGRLRVGLQYLLRRRGPLSLSVNQAGGFVRLRPESDRPDIQLYCSPLSYTKAPPGKRPMMRPDPFPAFLISSNPTRPTSRGHLAIRSADPFEAPEIHPNYLATEDDRRAMIDGIRLVRRIAAAPSLASVIETEVLPGPDAVTDDDLAAFVREQSWTVFHPCGTCRMGQDPAGAVVDPRLRVHGISALRVVDASIFPTIPTGNTNAPTIMVAEKAAGMILEDAAAPVGP